MSVQTSDSPRFNAWSGLIKCLTNPTAAFADLAEHPQPPFLLAYMVAGLLGVPLIYVSTQITLGVLQAQLAAQGLPPEANTVAQAIAYATAVGGGLFGPLLIGLCIALLAALVGLFVGGGVKFRQYLSMLAYAGLPSAIGGFVQGLLAFGATSLNQLQQISISPAAFLPAGSSPLILAVVGLINPFGLWSFYLLMVGFAALHRSKLAKGALFAGVLLVFQVLLLLWTGMKAIPQ